MIKTADWIIELGPEGGNRGGQIVAVGTPEEVATGMFLKKVLYALIGTVMSGGLVRMLCCPSLST